MDWALKARWVEALRSGKYHQGRKRLRKLDAFCCLGVLCDVMGAQWTNDGAEFEGTFGIGALPFAVNDRAGVSDDEERELIEMNDSGTSFLAIADYIERAL